MVEAEAAALWRELKGEAPPEGVRGAEILDLILGGLPEARYERLTDPNLRPFNITFPR